MRSVIFIVVCAIATSGCTFSVHPILTKDDLTKDVDLSGTWERVVPPDAKSSLQPVVVSLDGYDENTSYDAEYKQTAQEFELEVGKIGEQRYLQFTRFDLSLQDDAPLLARLPVYGLARFEVQGDELHVFAVDDQAVRKLLKKNDIAFRDYHPTDMLEWCVISEDTTALQKLIREHGDDLFVTQPTVFRRVPSDPRAKFKVGQLVELPSGARLFVIKQVAKEGVYYYDLSFTEYGEKIAWAVESRLTPVE